VCVLAAQKERRLVVQFEPARELCHASAVRAARILGPETQASVLQLPASHALGCNRLATGVQQIEFWFERAHKEKRPANLSTQRGAKRCRSIGRRQWEWAFRLTLMLLDSSCP